MKASERFLKYAAVDTASCEGTGKTPSTECQFELAKLLEQEICGIGLTDVYMDEHAYVYGKIPASKGFENSAKVGFIAHLDINSGDYPGGAKPQVIKNYDGLPVKLGNSGLVLDPKNFPHLKTLCGKTLITTDGTTVLGADDKAGIAAIVSMCEEIISGKLPHGEINVCFTPDEEVCHGAALLDLSRFDSDFAYTVDGSEPNDVQYETFNAAKADWSIKGFLVHAGSGKDCLINAALIASEINSMLPPGQTPRDTEGREGFWHLLGITGTPAFATSSYLLRDHDAKKFEERKQIMRDIEKQINLKYGEGTATLELHDEYRNMEEVILQHPEALNAARAAIAKTGMSPVSTPVRGGTDGSQISFRGLPCPNIGTGGYVFHGPYEYAVAEEIDSVTQILLGIAEECTKITGGK